MELANLTPLAAERAVFMDAEGAETLVVVIKATLAIAGDGRLALAEEQLPLTVAPVFAGDPATTSLIYETDLAPHKPAADCVLIGRAYAPHRGATEGSVTFRVGPMAKTLAVFGERRWLAGRGGTRASRPQPFDSIPLVYERAFGGVDTSAPDASAHESCAENPVGVGFRARQSRLPVDGAPLPNLEDPRALLRAPTDRPSPAGTGAVASSWQPRLRFAGTYDEAWRRSRAPLLPVDFDPRFFNAAAPGLVAPGYLRGDELVEVTGASPAGRMRAALPGLSPRVDVGIGLGRRSLDPKLDTLIVEPDAGRVQLVWRASRRVHGEVAGVHWIRIALDGSAEVARARSA